MTKPTKEQIRQVMSEIDAQYPNVPASVYWVHIASKLNTDSATIIEEVAKDLKFFNDKDNAKIVKSAYNS
jgi:hypothetical protein